MRERRVRPEHRSIVVVDMVGSSKWGNLAQLRARVALQRLVKRAFRRAGIAWWRLAVADRGDGMIILVPPSVSKVDLLDPLVPALVAGLLAHNAGAGPRIRLRVAVHAGEVLLARTGWVSADVNLACRLVAGEPLYRELARTDADLVLVVSERVHDGVVRHGYRGIDPADYAPVRIVVKEADVAARLAVPGVGWALGR
ncbi:hypothetical protein [Actinokineospora globicatena]|uniref:Guanylate cyclase domain-containing protein n=1 Tax=Actinokineospora globicatena TaxID=103729 RepID=A0A9W6V7Y4_9PSEU|nr:hypothetical protein [Actinokineospora globicatena]MCP2306477.1 hypothetical protein [Actinokineospora globicatena]GLW81906.1 hypothetical protein Aglo01_63870 [Actinokineospora globicatena]GLW89421.1 hypothetical protein Aglo03_02370 [Actinokineospora globicatena]